VFETWWWRQSVQFEDNRSLKSRDRHFDGKLTVWITTLVVRSAFFWDVTQRRLAVCRRRFGTTYRSHNRGSRVKQSKKNAGDIRRAAMYRKVWAVIGSERTWC
jgi:hypothetical protein